MNTMRLGTIYLIYVRICCLINNPRRRGAAVPHETVGLIVALVGRNNLLVGGLNSGERHLGARLPRATA
jgi:hypothetical protein